MHGKGLLFFSIQAIAAAVGSMAMMGFLMPLMLFPCSLKLHRKMADWVLGLWFLLPVSMLEILLGMKYRVTGDTFKRGETSLYILNHRTRLDWMWIWGVLYHHNNLRNIKIVLKSPLKWIPAFGWACQQAGFIFLKRVWQEDQESIEMVLDYFELIDAPMQLLLFPEGTDFNKQSHIRSQRFAKSHHLSEYSYVLHPKKTGFQYFVQKMRSNGRLANVYDMTVGYPKNIVENEAVVVQQDAFPKECHFHVERFAVDSLPADDEGLGTWIEDRFRKKEARLKEFYESDPDKRIFADKEQLENYEPRKFGLYFALIFWPVAIFAWCSALKWSHGFRIFQAIVAILYFAQPWWFGGMEFLLALLSKLFIKKNKAKKV